MSLSVSCCNLYLGDRSLSTLVTAASCPDLPSARAPWLWRRFRSQRSHQSGTCAFCHHRPCWDLGPPQECAQVDVCGLKMLLGHGILDRCEHTPQLRWHPRCPIGPPSRALPLPPSGYTHWSSLKACWRGHMHPVLDQMAEIGQQWAGQSQSSPTPERLRRVSHELASQSEKHPEHETQESES